MNRLPEESERAGMGRNVADFTHDVITLIELQGQLLIADLREGLAQGKLAGGVLLAAPVLALGAVPVLLYGIAELIVRLGGWSIATALLTVGGAAVMAAGLAGWWAWRRMQSSVALMTRSREELAENARWLKQALTRSRPVA